MCQGESASGIKEMSYEDQRLYAAQKAAEKAAIVSQIRKT
jgi:hypothetical protein